MLQFAVLSVSNQIIYTPPANALETCKAILKKATSQSDVAKQRGLQSATWGGSHRMVTSDKILKFQHMLGYR